MSTAAAAPVDRYCIVCCEEMAGKHVPAFGACNHRGVCSLCFLRMRAIVREFTCPVCKQELEHVIATPRNCTYQELQVWGEDIGPDYTYDHTARMFFPNEYFTNFVSKLWLYDCQVCGKKRKNLKELEAHLKTDHDLHICHSCAKHKQVFPSELKYYTQRDLDRHLRQGDPEEGGQGHPMCQFCKTRFYDKQALYEHLTKDHYSCHLCEKKGIFYQYYRDYASLETHFRNDHLLCEHPDCLQRRFVVFDSELELHAHIRTTHPDQKVPKSIPLNMTGFRYSRPAGGETKVEEQPIGEWTVEEFKGSEQDEEGTGEDAQGVDSFTVSSEEFPALAPVGPIYSNAPRSYGNRPPLFDGDFPALGETRPAPAAAAAASAAAAKPKPTAAAAVAAPRQPQPYTQTTMIGAWARAAAQSRRGGRYRNQHISLAPRRVTSGVSFANAVAPTTSPAVAAYMGEDPWADRIVPEPLTAPRTEEAVAPQGGKKQKAKKGKQPGEANQEVKQEAKQLEASQQQPPATTAAPAGAPLPRPPGFEDVALPLPSETVPAATAQAAQPKPAKAKKAPRKPAGAGGWSTALGSVGVAKPAKAGIAVVKFKRKPEAATGSSVEAAVQELRRGGGAAWSQPSAASAAKPAADSDDFPALPAATAAAGKKGKQKKQANSLSNLAFNTR